MWMLVAAFFAALFCINEAAVRDRVAVSVSRLYLAWWAACLVASSLDPIDMYPVSGFAYFLLLLGVAAFTAGFIVPGLGRSSAASPDAFARLDRAFQAQVVHGRGVLVVLVGFAAYLLRYYLRYAEALREAGPGEARNLRYGLGPVFGNAFEILVYNGLAEALAVAVAILLAYSLVLGSVRTWVFFWALVDLYLFASIGAGRTLIVQGAIFLALLAMLRGTLQPAVPGGAGAAGDGQAARPPAQRGNLVARLAAAAVLMTAFAVYLTFARLVSVEAGPELLQQGEMVELAAGAFLDNVWVYSVGPFRALDHALAHPSIYGFHFGRLTLAAVDEAIGVPLRMLGVDYPIMNREIATSIQDDILFIGSSDFNALYTAVFRFYYDFGVAGVAAFSFLFGALVRGAALWLQAQPSPVTLAVLLYLSSVSILSTQSWHLASLGAPVFLLGAWLLQRAAGPHGGLAPAGPADVAGGRGDVSAVPR